MQAAAAAAGLCLSSLGILRNCTSQKRFGGSDLLWDELTWRSCWGALARQAFQADGAAGYFFGSSVAVSSDGSLVVAGARYDDDAGSESGSAYVSDGASGAQLRKLRSADGAVLPTVAD